MTNDYKKFVAETFLQENQPKSRIIDTKNPNALLYILRNKWGNTANNHVSANVSHQNRNANQK